MTYEEALNEINQECVYCRTSNNCAKDECIWFLCKKAIDKQIPMKPTHEHLNFYCQSCGNWLLWDDAEPNDNDLFCPKCGQHILWEEEE